MYEFKQIFILEKRLYAYPFFLALIDSQEEAEKGASKKKLSLWFFFAALYSTFLCSFYERIVSWVSILCCAN